MGHSSGALSVDGVLYTWGSNSQSKLFHTGASSSLSPTSPRLDSDDGAEEDRDEAFDSRTQRTTNAKPPLPRRAVYKPRRVSAFDGQYVARFVLAHCNAYAFTPAQVHTGPQRVGQRVVTLDSSPSRTRISRRSDFGPSFTPN